MNVLKDYTTALERLFNRKPQRRSDIEIVKTLLEKWGNPHRAFPTVHVAGTNGKGQVSCKIAFALQSEGYKVGLFTSPHLFEYEERITVNGVKIPKETFLQYNEELEALLDQSGLDPNFFECTTCYCFRYFQEQNVDVAIIEAGLGGRFDATNVISPILSIITSISLDHTNYLGTTYEDIASQKAGIIKPNTPVVIGPRAKYAPIFEEAEQQRSPVHIVEKKSCFYDTENQAVAKEALRALAPHFQVKKASIIAGLKAKMPCRFEKRGNVILDVAHNPDGFRRLRHALEHLYPYRKFRFVVGIGFEKDYASCLKEIAYIASHFHFVEPKRVVGTPPEKLAETLRAISDCPCSIEESVYDGVKNAKAAAQKGDLIVICGSFYIMAESIQVLS
jgi:dihydrofolate synthase / folylpolyglutamate synthase